MLTNKPPIISRINLSKTMWWSFVFFTFSTVNSKVSWPKRSVNVSLFSVIIVTLSCT